MTRQLAILVALLAVSCGQLPDGSDGASADLATTAKIRLVAANLSSGNNQNYDPGEGIRILQGVHPDVVMMQEFSYAGGMQAIANKIICGADPAPSGCTAYVWNEQGYNGVTYQIPNGIVSRYPFTSTGHWNVTAWGSGSPNRGYAWACIDIPGNTDLCAISVHLNTSQIAQEGTDLVNYVNAAGWSAAGKYVVLGGDFNSSSKTTATVSNLSAAFTMTGPFPADQNGNQNTNSTRAKPYDWVVGNPALDALKTSSTIGSITFAAGAVIDTRVYNSTTIADISPALLTDSGATNMQHMAIVRDFNVPTDGTGGGSATVTVTAPNGGESWTAGTSHAITWTQSGVTNVKLEYTTNGGTSWSTIAASVAASTGTYTWTVPSTATTNAKVRVTDAANAATTDTSNAAFTIAAAAATDAFEPDNTFAEAKAIVVNAAAQTHNITPATDVDYVTFTTTATSNIRIETNGPTGGDSIVYLYNSSQSQIGTDDDSGVGYYSLLNKASLPAGTYYVKVQSYLNHTSITGYTLKVSTY